MTDNKPAPWHLTGDAYIMLYKFSKEFVQENGFLADFQKSRFIGYIGTVILVDYHSSEVGPYKELLFIPGMFTFNWKKVFSISKVYVSTTVSLENGKYNWGIPKELGYFEWTKTIEAKEDVRVKHQGFPFFSAQFKKSFFDFSFSSSFFPLTIVQEQDKDLIIIKPRFSGKLSIASMKKIVVDKNFFPDISKCTQLLTLKLSNFEMDFPAPICKKDYFK